MIVVACTFIAIGTAILLALLARALHGRRRRVQFELKEMAEWGGML
jgi:hypothetical protein